MKEQKIVNKLNKIVSNQATLHQKNNDECYTSRQDIAAELDKWAVLGKFEGKHIICPCDWNILEDIDCFSITLDFENGFKIPTVFENKFYRMPKIYYTIFDLLETDNKKVVQHIVTVPEKEVDEFLRNKVKNNFLRELISIAKESGIKSITASGYDPKTDRGIKFQDVDYSKYDICITNPPFSIMDEFVKTLLGDDYSQKKCDFIFLAPFMNRANPNIGLPLMLNKLYLGFGRHIQLVFDNIIDGSGNSVKKAVACDWIVSYPEAQNEVNESTNPHELHYEDYKEDFLVYQNITMKDGTHPIRVAGNLFPTDYNGWMCGPINVLDRIMDTRKYEWYGTNFKKFFNSTHPELSPFAHKLSDKLLTLNGKQCFAGIIFRKKQNNYGK